MAANTINMLAAAARSMENVIIPAVDPSHPLAKEQAGLVLKVLGLLEKQLPFIDRRDRFELSAYVDTAEQVLQFAEASPALYQRLEQAKESGVYLLSLNSPLGAELHAASGEIASILSALVRFSEGFEESQRRALETAVLRGSNTIISAQQSWFVGQGWASESDAAPLEEMFGGRSVAQTDMPE